MITCVHLVNFKCFKDLTVNLGPFTVLIGPNDSGKSALMEGISLIAELGHVFARDVGLVHQLESQKQMPRTMQTAELERRLQAVFTVVDNHLKQRRIDLESYICKGTQGDTEIALQDREAGKDVHLSYARKGPIVFSVIPAGGQSQEGGGGPPSNPWSDPWFGRVVAARAYIHFNPAALKRDSKISDSSFAEDGQGFPTYLENLLRKDRPAFFEMEKAFYARFPQYANIKVEKVGDQNALQFELKGGGVLWAHQVSDGAVLYLAFMAMSFHPSPPSIYLIEEPETGVHPSGLKAIVDALRHLVDRGKQVIVATHSPHLLDLVKPEEVRIFTRNKQLEIEVKEMDKIPDVEGWTKSFSTGEIWTNLLPELEAEAQGAESEK
jgi:predicted ATPase